MSITIITTDYMCTIFFLFNLKREGAHCTVSDLKLLFHKHVYYFMVFMSVLKLL